MKIQVFQSISFPKKMYLYIIGYIYIVYIPNNASKKKKIFSHPKSLKFLFQDLTWIQNTLLIFSKKNK